MSCRHHLLIQQSVHVLSEVAMSFLTLHRAARAALMGKVDWGGGPRVYRVRRGNSRMIPLIRRIRENLAAISVSEGSKTLLPVERHEKMPGHM